MESYAVLSRSNLVAWCSLQRAPSTHAMADWKWTERGGHMSRCPRHGPLQGHPCLRAYITSWSSVHGPRRAPVSDGPHTLVMVPFKGTECQAGGVELAFRWKGSPARTEVWETVANSLERCPHLPLTIESCHDANFLTGGTGVVDITTRGATTDDKIGKITRFSVAGKSSPDDVHVCRLWTNWGPPQYKNVVLPV